jgi:hypothetical protein
MGQVIQEGGRVAGGDVPGDLVAHGIFALIQPKLSQHCPINVRKRFGRRDICF